MLRRSVRARIRAYGSSADSFAAPKGPVAIRPSPVDMRMNLDVFGMFPSVESAD